MEEILRQDEEKLFGYYKSRNDYTLIIKMSCCRDLKIWREITQSIELELWFEILYFGCQMCMCNGFCDYVDYQIQLFF